MKVNYERKIVHKRQTYLELEGLALEEALGKVSLMIREYGGDALIERVCDPHTDSDRETLYIFKDEPETDEEMSTRIAHEEKYAKLVEACDAAEFKRLQEKFGVK